jgi:hypothetical protein
VFAAMLSLEEPRDNSNRGIILRNYASSVWEIVEECTDLDPCERPTAGQVKWMLSP